MARKLVQEFKQRFLDCAVGSSTAMSMGQPVYNVIKAERKLAESWTQVEAEDRAVREQLEREEAEHIAQAKEEKEKQRSNVLKNR